MKQLATACDVSVDTVRYYQSRGLLAALEREGRVAWYGPEHAERIGRSARYSARLTLAAIRRVVSGELGPPTRISPPPGGAEAATRTPSEADGSLTLEEFSGGERRTRVPDPGGRARGHPARPPRRRGGPLHRRRHRARTHGAAPARVRLPLPDLLALARDADAAMRGLAVRAVDLFDEHVRKPIRDTAGDDERAAEQMVEAFRELLPAVTTLVSHHFRRVLLETAEATSRSGHDRGASVNAPLPQGEGEAPRSPRAVRLDLARYDLVNRVMTFGMDVGLAARGRRGATASRLVVRADLACGTGDFVASWSAAGTGRSDSTSPTACS